MSKVDEDPNETGEAEPCEERRTYRERWRGRRRMRRRFQDRYEHRRAEREAGRHHPLTRPIRVTSGVVLILIGVAIGWLPGPGFVIFAFPGALLIASEWRRAAMIMDRVEHEAVPWIRHVRAKLRGGPKPEWVEDDPAAWGVWQDRRTGDAPDSGARMRCSDEATSLEDRDDGSASAEAHSA
jgi:hypothetical protein